ncbi:hypothetical protein FA95DRAFT_1586223 [Auriscalpium vulgare]|uniref:Uncharacterized protein n=1 Tax=Auriscalpium vulgare TaxID=40419 RepID=A0ACB8SAL1_9AGAM|nr:hypothetical protein FA95DRAFT_1586223 [Auriscalpium vulgare]
MAEEDSLVRRRSRRSTAGNRMEAALAELTVQDANNEAEEDIDFVIDRDEEDVFGSDFESTDDEAATTAPEAGDKAVHEEERRERKTTRSRVDRATAVAHARQRVTFNPEAYEAELVAAADKESAGDAAKKKRRVSLGLAIDAETGEVVNNAKRQSRRTHTVLNPSASASRMKKEVEEKKGVPKKVKVKVRALTQDELIARALDMEEGNIMEHRNYLTVEAEKRKRAHAVRTVVEGPLLRWVSKREDVPVVAQVLPQASSSSKAVASQIQAPLPPLAPPRMETVAKNYVVHEVSQTDSAPRPPWKDTMAAMFGGDVDWEVMKVYVTKGRPLTRYIPTCPITGQPAHYLDPRTNVPYATPAAYDVLTQLLKHEYVWSATMGSYVAHESERARVEPAEAEASTSRKRQRTKSRAAPEATDTA